MHPRLTTHRFHYSASTRGGGPAHLAVFAALGAGRPRHCGRTLFATLTWARVVAQQGCTSVFSISESSKAYPRAPKGRRGVRVGLRRSGRGLQFPRGGVGRHLHNRSFDRPWGSHHAVECVPGPHTFVPCVPGDRPARGWPPLRAARPTEDWRAVRGVPGLERPSQKTPAATAKPSGGRPRLFQIVASRAGGTSRGGGLPLRRRLRWERGCEVPMVGRRWAGRAPRLAPARLALWLGCRFETWPA